MSKLAIGQANPYFFSFPAVALGVVFFAPVSLARRAGGAGGPRAPAPLRMTARHWRVIALAALFSFAATLLYYVALSLAEVTRVSSLVRANLLFGFLLSYYFLGEREGWRRKLAAGARICAGTVIVSLTRAG